MAIPVINTTTSVLGYKQWEHWEYQPWATNSPTSWACPNLPTGLSINSGTGKISGAAEVAGVFNVGLVATNGTGDSLPLVLTIGIDPSAAVLTSGALEVAIDVLTRAVSYDAAGLFSGEGDDVMLAVTFKKGSSVLDLALEGLGLAFKEFEPDPKLVVSDGFLKKGSGAGTYYLIHATLEREALAGALSNYEADRETAFAARAEIEWIESNPDTADLGPATLRQSSRLFDWKIGRDVGEVSG